MAIHSATILIAENKKLRAVNERVKKKKGKKKLYIGKGGALSVTEVREA